MKRIFSLWQSPSGSRRALLGGAVLYGLANVLANAIPFLLLPILTRVLSPYEYGLIALFAAIMAAFAAFTGLGVDGAVNVRYYERDGAHARYVGTALMVLASSTACVVLTACLVASVSGGWQGLSTLWLGLAALAAGAQFVLNIRLSMWQVQGQAARYGMFQVLQAAFNVGLSLLLVVSLELGWQGRATAMVLAVGVFGSMAVIMLHREHLVEWRFERKHAVDVLRFGLPLVPYVLGSVLVASTDRVVLAAMLTLQDVGVYAAAMQVGLIIAVVADAGVKAFTPWLYEGLASGSESARRRIVRTTYLFFAGIIALALVFGALAPYALMIVGREFRAGQDVVLYVAIGGAFAGMYRFVVSYVFYAKRNELLSAATLLTGSFHLAATWYLVGRNGVTGAAQAFAVSQAALFVAVWLIAAKCYPMPWRGALRRAAPRPASA